MISDPEISVLMSVYNDELYLKEAIDSILNQTFTNFEFIIINDASTDSSRAIIENYHDDRIRLLNNDQNQRLPQCLNQGIKIARGKYIARMDSDDISLPPRLEKQAAFMDANPAIGVCGTWVKVFGAGREWIRELPVDPASMRCNFVFEHQMVHPTIVMRKEFILQHNLFYNPDYVKAQDYELWCRCGRYFPLANIDEVLLLYRQRENRGDIIKEQQRLSEMIQLNEIRALGVEPTPEEFKLHMKISLWIIYQEPEFLSRIRLWLDKLTDANSKTGYYPEPAFTHNITNRWLKIIAVSGINDYHFE